jgi:hypothetical protein
MSHFAKIENGIVTEVIVAEQDYIDTLDGQWVQTSYNAKIRKNYAGIGYTYDEKADAFIAPKPFESWKLNNVTYQWETPIPMPQSEKICYWDEASLSWKEQE